MSKARKQITLTPERRRSRDELVATIERGYEAVDQLTQAYADIAAAYVKVEQSLKAVYGIKAVAHVDYPKDDAALWFIAGHLWVITPDGDMPLRSAPTWARIGAVDLLAELEEKLKALPHD